MSSRLLCVIGSPFRLLTHTVASVSRMSIVASRVSMRFPANAKPPAEHILSNVSVLAGTSMVTSPLSLWIQFLGIPAFGWMKRRC